MIVEHKREIDQDNGIDQDVAADSGTDEDVASVDSSFVRGATPMQDATFSEYLSRHMKIRNREDHFQLRKDLMEHIWHIQGNTI